MIKTFCDICEDEIEEIPQLSYIDKKGIVSDTTALVRIRVVTEFKNHSSGLSGGSPDLCAMCLAKLIHKIWDGIK